VRVIPPAALIEGVNNPFWDENGRPALVARNIPVKNHWRHHFDFTAELIRLT